MGKTTEHLQHARIAVLGAGLIGRKHVDVVASYADLDAVIDPDPATRDLAVQKNAPWFPDLASYLDGNRPDGIIVATPNQMHLPHGKACIDAGIPVLVEKPLADSAQDARSLAELSDAASVPILVGHHRRHSQVAQAAKRSITAGQLGAVVAVHAQFWLHKPASYFETRWRTEKGGGPSFINLIHDIDLLRFFCGEVVSVQAMASHAIRGFDVEDTSVAILRFQSGALGTITISDTIAAPWSWELTSGENPIYPRTQQSCYQIGGTLGSLSIPDLTLWQPTGENSWWEPIAPTELSVAQNDPMVAQFLHFLDILQTGCPPLVTAIDGARNIAVLDAICRAAASGPVDLET